MARTLTPEQKARAADKARARRAAGKQADTMGTVDSKFGVATADMEKARADRRNGRPEVTDADRIAKAQAADDAIADRKAMLARAKTMAADEAKAPAASDIDPEDLEGPMPAAALRVVVQRTLWVIGNGFHPDTERTKLVELFTILADWPGHPYGATVKEVGAKLRAMAHTA